MTRESAKKHFWTDTEEFGESVAKRFGNINYEKIFTGYYIGSEIDKFIDKIYDDFKARTCRRCKYCDTRDTPMVCMKMDVPTSYADIPDEKYGCTRWEAKI